MLNNSKIVKNTNNTIQVTHIVNFIKFIYWIFKFEYDKINFNIVFIIYIIFFKIHKQFKINCINIKYFTIFIKMELYFLRLFVRASGSSWSQSNVYHISWQWQWCFLVLLFVSARSHWISPLSVAYFCTCLWARWTRFFGHFIGSWTLNYFVLQGRASTARCWQYREPYLSATFGRWS